jgi:membrane protein required for colicin V production
MEQAWAALGWIDLAMLVVALVSMVIGLVRGFVFECLALAGWVVAWFAAQWAAPWAAPYVPVGTAGGGLNLGVSFALAFVALLIAWALLARLVRMLIHASPLSLADRLLGAVFGALRALVLLLALASVVALTPAAQSPPWQASIGARASMQMLVLIKPMLPQTVARLLPA